MYRRKLQTGTQVVAWDKTGTHTTPRAIGSRIVAKHLISQLSRGIRHQSSCQTPVRWDKPERTKRCPAVTVAATPGKSFGRWVAKHQSGGTNRNSLRAELRQSDVGRCQTPVRWDKTGTTSCCNTPVRWDKPEQWQDHPVGQNRNTDTGTRARPVRWDITGTWSAASCKTPVRWDKTGTAAEPLKHQCGGTNRNFSSMDIEIPVRWDKTGTMKRDQSTHQSGGTNRNIDEIHALPRKIEEVLNGSRFVSDPARPRDELRWASFR